MDLDTTSMFVARNMTGTFTSKLANNATIYSMLETRWRGIVIRRNFADVTADGVTNDGLKTIKKIIIDI